MKVKELITLLGTHDPEMDIEISEQWEGYIGTYAPIHTEIWEFGRVGYLKYFKPTYISNKDDLGSDLPVSGDHYSYINGGAIADIAKGRGQKPYINGNATSWMR
jgi:hypothetical protein